MTIKNIFKMGGSWLGGFTGLLFFLIMYFQNSTITLPNYLIFAYAFAGLILGWSLEELTLYVVKKEKIEL